MRLLIAVIEDTDSALKSDDEAAAVIATLLTSDLIDLRLRMIRRGGFLAKQLLGEFVPVRHERMGRPNG